MMRPVRLQLSRRKGFDLQAWSRQVNGLEGVNCARPSRFGNPCYVGMFRDYSAADAVMGFKRWIHRDASGPFYYRRPPTIDEICEKLRGKNLACWCHLCPKHAAAGKPLDEHCSDCAPCHVDVLGEIICESIHDDQMAASAR